MDPEMPSTSRGRKRTWSSALEILSEIENDSDSLSSLSEMEIESEDKFEVPPFSDIDFVWETADKLFEARAPNFDVQGPFPLRAWKRAFFVSFIDLRLKRAVKIEASTKKINRTNKECSFPSCRFHS